MSKYEIIDWSQTDLPLLHAFEDTISCPICRELLVRAPKITDCGHTFCSECITRYMTQQNTCPVCRTPIHRGALRANKKVEDIADLWVAETRPALLKALSKREETLLLPVAKTSSNSSTSSATTTEIDGSGMPSSEAGIPQLIEQPSTRQSRSRQQQGTHGLAECPICQKLLPVQQLQTTHIDRCLSNGSSGTGTSSPGSSPQKRRAPVTGPIFGREYPQSKLSLPTVDAMTETKLRNKLKDAGLSSKGNKPRLKARYTEWVTIYNASVDDKHPQTVQELRKRMIQWDKAQDRAQEVPPNLKELDAKSWTDQHRDQYLDLIDQARMNKKRRVQGPDDSKE